MSDGDVTEIKRCMYQYPFYQKCLANKTIVLISRHEAEDRVNMVLNVHRNPKAY